MKSLTVRLPVPLVNEIDAESRVRKMSRSDVVRERLTASRRRVRARPASFDAIADLVGSVDHLPADVSERRKHYLSSTGYGRTRRR